MTATFDPVTIYFCTTLTTFVVAVALTYSNIMRKREQATVWWCCSMWVVSVGLFFLSIRDLLPAPLALGVGNALILLGYGLGYIGCAAFTRSSTSPAIGCLGAGLWLALYFGLDSFSGNTTVRVVFVSSVIVVYSVLSAFEVWRGWKVDRLPSFLSLYVLYITHAGIHLMRAVAHYFYPELSTNTIADLGLTALNVENFVHAIGISFFFFAVIKERAEQKYRLAAEIDSLTETATRRFFVSETREKLAAKPKAGVIAIIDVDHFKAVNDSFGHLGGDRVLQAFGSFLNDRKGPDMVIGRLGGEEFGIFLPGMEASEGREWLDTLRIEVEQLRIVFMNNPIRITVSVGAASIRDAGVDFDHLMAAADGALYIAKEEGRNRLRVFVPSMRLHRIQEEGADMRLGLATQRLSRSAVRSTIGKPDRQ